MSIGIIGRKLGMTHRFDEKGNVIPLTVIEAGPCSVIQKKTVERDAYCAVQIGFDTFPEKRAQKLVNKPETGHFARSKSAPTRYLRELRLTSDEAATLNEGDQFTLDQFVNSSYFDVIGTSKWRG